MSTLSHLTREISSFALCFEGKETESNWSERDQAIQRMKCVVRGIQYIEPTPSISHLSDAFKPVIGPLCQTVITIVFTSLLILL